MALSKQQITDAASKFGLDYATVAAVASVESSGSGFNKITKFPVILFEGHIFSRLTGKKFDMAYPSLSYPKWTKVYYAKDQVGENKRLQQAIALNRDAALQSTSWGMFQIMGFNFSFCGCDSVQEFVNKMCSSEQTQLEMFLTFVKNQNLIGFLQKKDLASFARGYNGPDFKINNYDTKLAANYAKFR